MIKASELDDVFQPQGSFHLGIGQSSAEPHAVCHPQQPWLCTLACGGGGWCDWGRRGTGECSCWYNIRAAEETWNPLDNVCIGNDRFDPFGSQTFEEAIKSGAQDGKFVEQCPAYGYCENGGRSREMCLKSSPTKAQCGNTFVPCGANEFVGDDKNMSVPKRIADWSPWDDWAADGIAAGPTAPNCGGDLGQCFVHRTINWRHSNSKITCKAD